MVLGGSYGLGLPMWGFLCDLKVQFQFQKFSCPISHFLPMYSLVRLVWQNTEELISRPFTGLYKIRLLLRDRMRTKNLRF